MLFEETESLTAEMCEVWYVQECWSLSEEILSHGDEPSEVEERGGKVDHKDMRGEVGDVGSEEVRVVWLVGEFRDFTPDVINEICELQRE
jgi:hypothetical protein